MSESIYELISNAVIDGNLPKDFRLPKPDDEQKAMFADGALDGILGEISAERGGRCAYGSMVWADIHEMADPIHKSHTDIIQIVGHTQMASGLLNLEAECHLYDVDARRCVCIDEEGTVRELG